MRCSETLNVTAWKSTTVRRRPGHKRARSCARSGERERVINRLGVRQHNFYCLLLIFHVGTAERRFEVPADRRGGRQVCVESISWSENQSESNYGAKTGIHLLFCLFFFLSFFIFDFFRPPLLFHLSYSLGVSSHFCLVQSLSLSLSFSCFICIH